VFAENEFSMAWNKLMAGALNVADLDGPAIAGKDWTLTPAGVLNNVGVTDKATQEMITMKTGYVDQNSACDMLP
jgi:hypothetical protein